ncbi:MAG TPA: hypothetical protein VLJ59_20065 [Mycobacteriales bacterium]|nr:hypothetical protein [Mycobacteriales bacterium]
MSPLIWVAMPVAVTVVATLWALWVARDPGRTDAHSSVQAHHRFVEALSRNVRPLAARPTPAVAKDERTDEPSGREQLRRE